MKNFVAAILFVCVLFSFSYFCKAEDNHDGYLLLSVDMIDMPWLREFEAANDLEFAASANEDLKALVKEYSAISDASTLYEKFDNLISVWIGENKTNEDMHKFVLAKLMKLELCETDKYKPENIELAYTYIKNRWFLHFVSQMEFGKMFGVKYDYRYDKLEYGENVYENMIKHMTDSDNFIISFILADRLVSDKEINVEKLGKAIKHYGYGAHIINYVNSKDKLIPVSKLKIDERPVYVIGSSANDKITGNDNPDIIYGREGNDTLKGAGGDDWLAGGQGNDDIYGQDGQDILIGGEGQNNLYGGGGNDIYIYDGKGNDVIRDEKWATVRLQKWYWDPSISDYRDKWVDDGRVLIDGGNDTVIFGELLSKNNIIPTRIGDNLVFKVNNTGKTLTIKNWYASKEQRVENFKFVDGSRYEVQELLELKNGFTFDIIEKVRLCIYKNFNSFKIS